jgi:hypothetical protein
MRLRLLLFDSTDFSHEIEEGKSVAELRASLIAEHGVIHSRSLFFRHQALLPDDYTFKSSQFQDDNTVVVFNSLSYPEKSFPKVDGAFRFPLARYDDFWIDLYQSEELPQGQNLATDDVGIANGTQLILTTDDLNAIARLRQTGLSFTAAATAYIRAHRDEALALRLLTGTL